MSPSTPKPLELWLPALDRFDPAHPLHRLLAQADRMADGPRGYLSGLGGYFQCDAEPLPAAALSRELLAGDAADATWLSADPAWVQPDMNGARLLACGQLQLSEAEAQALAQPLMPVFEDAGMRLMVSSPDRWHLRLAAHEALPAFAAPVKGATLIGSGPEVLTRVSMIGNDMKLDDGVGVCGKDGQSVPVGVGQPTLKIDGMTVGGTAS